MTFRMLSVQLMTSCKDHPVPQLHIPEVPCQCSFLTRTTDPTTFDCSAFARMRRKLYGAPELLFDNRI